MNEEREEAHEPSARSRLKRTRRPPGGTSRMIVFHVSEEPGIEVFKPPQSRSDRRVAGVGD